MLWYTTPAENWNQALPIGNGRLGAMVFGQPKSDRLQLNEITVWSGGPNPHADRGDAFKFLPELREQLRDGKYDQATKFAAAHFNGPATYEGSYQTLGDLIFEHALPDGPVENYDRRLDLENAIASVTFTAGGVKFNREIFSTAPGEAIVHRITGSVRGSINFTVGLSRPAQVSTRIENGNTLVMTGDTGPCLKFEARARVQVQGGTLRDAGDGKLIVANADDAMIILTAATTYALDPAHNYQGGDLSRAARQLDAACSKPYDKLKSDHIADYHSIFNRMTLDLGPAKSDLPTDRRLKSYRGDHDPAFAALFFQFGRYLLISSSRANNPLPANLQGLWADGLDLPWNGDYHTNINLQMNYWPAGPANLIDLQMPLVRFTQSLTVNGARSAKAYFGADTRGWMLGYTTNAWGWTSPGKAVGWGVWFGGGGWLCSHLWEQYAYTQDIKYLREIYPTIKGAAEFYLSTMNLDKGGRLITSPSTSPENNFVTDDGMESNLTEGATMERAIAWDTLNNVVAAGRILGTDAEFTKKAAVARDKIRPLQIGRAGQLLEWNEDWDLNAKDPHHRHVSHAYPLFPGNQITLVGTPDLAAAVKKTLELRGDNGTGWALAWKINLWARLRDGDHALALIDNQLRFTEQTKIVMEDAGGTYPNLFDAHPPFQIDGNFGYVSGVSEMLLQSHEQFTDPASPSADRYYIDLLPALPKAWTDGQARGLRARGGFQVDMTWKAGRLTTATINNCVAVPTEGKVRYGKTIVDLRLQPGERRVLSLAGH